jgi:two-component system, NtrC family, response regulator GlrR
VVAEGIGRSARFREAVTRLARIAKYDVPALITGETGTGKDLAARSIHYQSARHEGPFIPVNCGGLPDALVENELFGHERGAYTDARNRAPGVVELAHRGTLFLDELGALSTKAQFALLRFLQDNRYRPLGASADRQTDVRVIAATNQDLDALVAAGLFRADLLFRLKVMVVEIPPLRLRVGDADLLAQHFLQQCAERFRLSPKRLDASTQAWLDAYDWPGNVRELEHLIQRECLMSDGDVISYPARSASDDSATALAPRSYRVAKQAMIEAFDRRFLIDVLAMTGGNVSQAAHYAQKERRAFSRLLAKYGISPNDYRR